MTSSDILANLQKIVKSEKLNVNDEALALIARYSDGAMRDAQVLLDQLVSFTKGSVGAEDVSKMLGMVSDDVLFKLADCIKGKDAPAALAIVDSFFNDGKDMFQVVLGLITHFRNIAVSKITKAASMPDHTKEKAQMYKAASEKFTIEEILYFIYTLSNTIDFMRKSGLSRVPLEAAVIKLSRAGSIESLEQVLHKIEGLGSRPPAATRDAPVRPKPQNTTSDAAPNNNLRAEASTDLDEMLSAWSGVINHIMPKKVSIAHYLQEGYPVAVEGNTVIIGFPKDLRLHKDVLEEASNRKMIEEAIRAKLNIDLKVGFRLEEKSARPAVDSKTDDGEELPDINQPLEDDSRSDSDPIVNTALEMFGGEISPEQRLKRKAQ
jgi:DNA polymerase-3 subunit gamma/tau